MTRTLRHIYGIAFACLAASACQTTGKSSVKGAPVAGHPDAALIASLVQDYPRTKNAHGDAGDVINVAAVTSRDQLINAFSAAGWAIPDPLTVQGSIDIAVAATMEKNTWAPVSNLFLFDRVEDLAFEFVNSAPRSRHHVRFWQSNEKGSDGNPIWLGAASFDVSANVSFTGGVRFTHVIEANVDEERDYIASDLRDQGLAGDTYGIPGIGAASALVNADGERIRTDGKVVVLNLDVVPDRSPPAVALPKLEGAITDDAAQAIIRKCAAQWQSELTAGTKVGANLQTCTP